MSNRDTENEFSEFKEWFQDYQELFGLNGYHIYFIHEPLENKYAEIVFNNGQNRQVITIKLNSNLPDEDRERRTIQETAKHESIHLLLCRLEQRARDRYSSSAEITEATEELVYKLEGLIPD